MSISKDILKQACKEVLDNYKELEGAGETFDDLEETACNFSDLIMERALELKSGESSKSAEKKTFVKNVEKAIKQWEEGKRPY
jgi:hypothetical protein